MADVFRAPLVVGRRDTPVQRPSSIFAIASLLVTTLAFAPIPVGAQSFPLQDEHGRRLSLNQDSTHGSPKTLLADAQRPVGGASHVGTPPTRPAQWLNPDTTQDSPQTLRADAQKPTFVAPGFALDTARARAWLPADTTAGQPMTLRPIPAPLTPAPDIEPLRIPWLPADSTRGTPQTLRADAQAPVGTAATFTAPDRQRWLPADTTSSIPSAVRTPAPFVPAPYLQALRVPWLPADTTLGSAQTLRPDSQAPVGDAQTFTAPDRARWLPADASASLPSTLRAFIPAPFAIAPDVEPARLPWLPSDSSRSSPKTLLADARAPVGTAQTIIQPDKLRWLTDTTQGTPAALRAIVPAPFVPAPDLEVLRRPWLAAELTQGTPETLRQDAQAPVGKAQTASAPERARWLPADTSRAAAKAIPAPFIPAPDVEPVRRPWLAPDTAAGTPKTLFADSRAPVGTAQTNFAPDRARHLEDTTAGTGVGLRTVVAPPFVPAPHLAPVAYIARPFDVVPLGVPKTLVADAQLPVRNLQHTPPDAVRPVVDTSFGQLPRLAPVVPPADVRVCIAAELLGEVDIDVQLAGRVKVSAALLGDVDIDIEFLGCDTCPPTGG